MGTALVGMIHDAATFGVLTDDPHAEGGEDGDKCEDEDGGHEVILNEKSEMPLLHMKKKKLIGLPGRLNIIRRVTSEIPLPSSTYSIYLGCKNIPIPCSFRIKNNPIITRCIH